AETRGDLLLEAARRVDRFLGSSPFGLRLAPTLVRPELLRSLPDGLRFLILTEPADGDWDSALRGAWRPDGSVLAEVTSRGSARDAARVGVDGLILSGHEAGGRGSEESSFILLQGVVASVDAPVWVRGGIGPNTAAACIAAGASGVVLDGALLLA